MADQGVAARRSAVWLLDQVIDEGRLMSEVQYAPQVSKLSPEDRARAQRLALETMRNIERADRILQKHVRKYPPTSVRNALRVGTVELCQGEAAHGVVNSFVTIVGALPNQGHMKGLTNAVLRKVAADGAEMWATLRAPRLPKWLRNPLSEAWGPEAMAAMEQAHLAGAPLDLTVKGDPQTVAKALNGTVLPTGSVRLAEGGQVTAMQGFTEGDWWVQDAAAAIPVKLLGDVTGLNALDMCAAPGGKTLQLAAGGATVTAIDDSERRVTRVHDNLKRTKLEAAVIVQDVLEHQAHYDVILLDAPCSATGTIRRHPDLPHAKDGSEFFDLMQLQTQMLDHAWSLLKPNGRLVFCTCSLLPDEGEVHIEEALERHADMDVLPIDTAAYGLDPKWLSEEGGLRLRPDYWADQGGMDGFYMAVLRKAA